MPKDFKNPYLQHSWGKTADQKRKEQEYNRRYYELHKKDKWGVGEETRQSSGTSENVSSNRPMARQKNVTEGGNGVQRRGEGLNTGSVGSPYGRPVQKLNPYKSDAYANSARTNGPTASPSSIEARKAIGRYKDRRAAASAARSNAAAESEQARMSVSEAKIKKRNAAMARAAAAAESAQAHQQASQERYNDFKKSKTYEMQEQAKRKDAQDKAAYQERQNEVKKAISKKNGIQNEITNISNTIKRLQKEDPKGNAIKINSLYKQLDDKKTAYKNMQAYINALNF